MRKITPVLALALAGAVPAAAATAPHPFNAHDLHEMQRLSDPQPSPDGRSIAFVVRTTDFEANKGRNDIWLVGLDGTGLTQLTSDPAPDTNPRWAPDGKNLYFLSARSGSTQVWRLPIPGTDKQALQVTDLPFDVANLTLSPDGKRIAFSLEVYPRLLHPRLHQGTPGRQGEEQDLGAALRRRLRPPLGFVERWTAQPSLRRHPRAGWQGGRAGGSEPRPGLGRRAVPPGRRRRGVGLHAGRPELVFAARWPARRTAKSPGPPTSTSTRCRWTARRRRATSPPPISPGTRQPAFSPDGKTLAYLRHEARRLRGRPLLDRPARPGDRQGPRDRRRLGPLARTGCSSRRTARPCTARRATSGQHPLFAIDVATGKVRKVVAEGHARTSGSRRRPPRLRPRHPDGAGRAVHRQDRRLRPEADHPLQQGPPRRRPLRRVRAVLTSPVRTATPCTAASSSRWASRRARSIRSPSSSTAARRARSTTSSTTAGTRRSTPARATPCVDDRLPRLDRLRPGLHRRDQRRLGRQAAGGPAEGARRGRSALPLARRRPRRARSAPPTAAT